MTTYELNEQDIKNIKFSPRVNYVYTRFENGWVIKRIETTFVRDEFLDNIKSGKYDSKPKGKDNSIKLE